MFRRLAFPLVSLSAASVLKAANAAPAGAPFPVPLDQYQDPIDGTAWQVIASRASADPFNLAALIVFACAIIHTFFTAKIRHWAHVVEERHAAKRASTQPAPPAELDSDGLPEEVSFPGQMLHFLGEIEAVFGIWVVVLVGVITAFKGWGAVVGYIGQHVSFTEPLFVAVVMTLAATHPVLGFAERCLRAVARLGGGSPGAWWLAILLIAPLFGSLITEPAAMTIGALLLSRQFYELQPSFRFRYATLGLLFVNVSVGGMLTHFAAPPVIMVAHVWHWNLGYMLTHFGAQAVVGILISTTLYYFVFRRELQALQGPAAGRSLKVGRPAAPLWITTVQLALLGFTVWQAHYPAMFIGAFLFFLAFSKATAHHQSRLDLRAPILVGFFLAGLVIHGGLQAWWIEPILRRLGEIPLFIGAAVLTAFNDNAAITYLASLVPGFSEPLKHAVVAGAVTGGGLTVIANAPNPAGQSILGRHFPDGVAPLKLGAAALAPTVIVALAFMLA
jgi:hypothetical protein